MPKRRRVDKFRKQQEILELAEKIEMEPEGRLLLLLTSMGISHCLSGISRNKYKAILKRLSLVGHVNACNERSDALEAKQTSLSANSEVVDKVIKAYVKGWEKRYKSKCASKNGRVRAKIKKLLREIGEQELLKRLKVYLKKNDEWLVERTHAIEIFLSTSDRYVEVGNGKTKAEIIRADDIERDIEAFKRRRNKKIDR